MRQYEVSIHPVRDGKFFGERTIIQSFSTLRRALDFAIETSQSTGPEGSCINICSRTDSRGTRILSLAFRPDLKGAWK